MNITYPQEMVMILFIYLFSLGSAVGLVADSNTITIVLESST